MRTSPDQVEPSPTARDRARKAILSPDRHLAAFDLENTLIASNVVDSYAWLASRHLPAAERAAFVADLIREAPSLLLLDRRDRGTSSAPSTGATRARRSTGSATTDGSSSHDLLLAKSFPAGIARVREHRALGHRTVLITGALDLVVEPLRPLFDDIVCAHLGEVDGKFTGRLDELPPIGEARALVLADYAEAEGLELEESMAYADSASDLPMLEAVGFPGRRQSRGQACRHRPPARMARRALGQGGRRRGHLLLPLGPLDHRGSLGRHRPSGRPLWPAPHGGPVDGCPTMKALVLERNVARFAASRVASLLGSGRGAGIGPLQLLDAEPPELPGHDWFHLRPLLSGICGSDLATLDGRSSRYFEDMVSFPFVPGHEVVGILDDGGTDRVEKLSPPELERSSSRCSGALPDTSAPCAPSARQGQTGLCGNVAFGELAPGLRPGSAPTPVADGRTPDWPPTPPSSTRSPSAFSDEDAVMVEPTACAVHAALSAGIETGGHRGRGRGGDARPGHGGRPRSAGSPDAGPARSLVGAKHRPPAPAGRRAWVPMLWSPPTSWPGRFAARPARWSWPVV